MEQISTVLGYYALVWSPDSKKLVFSSDAQGFYDIATYDITRGTVSWLTEGIAEDLDPVYSPNGKLMIFVRPVARRASWIATSFASLPPTVKKS